MLDNQPAKMTMERKSVEKQQQEECLLEPSRAASGLVGSSLKTVTTTNGRLIGRSSPSKMRIGDTSTMTTAALQSPVTRFAPARHLHRTIRPTLLPIGHSSLNRRNSGFIRRIRDLTHMHLNHDSQDAHLSCFRPMCMSSIFLAMIIVLLYVLILYPNLIRGKSDDDPGAKQPEQVAFKMSSQQMSAIGELRDAKLPKEPPPYDKLPFAYVQDQIPRIHTPILYTLTFRIYLPWKPNVTFGEKNWTIDGHLSMDFVSGGGRRILLHSKEIFLKNAVVIQNDRTIRARKISFEYPEIADIWLEEEMLLGNATLEIDFISIINKLNNFEAAFVNTYKIDGETRLLFIEYNNIVHFLNLLNFRYLMATHLQPTNARRLFPCLDVPDAKAYFQATVEHPIGTNALSNTLEASVHDSGNWTISQFERTPIMSTYLFAISVNDFPFMETKSTTGTRLRVYAQSNRIEDFTTGFKSLAPLLSYYEDYFGIKYPLKKLDVLAIPAMKMTAMENWGLITVTQKFVLYREGLTGVHIRYLTCEVLGHEIAHMWFGNLVTMRFWDNLWLNEGFATMISAKANSKTFNLSVYFDHRKADDIAVTLRNDQTIYQAIVTKKYNQDPNELFQSIVYRKSNAVIRMLEKVIGTEKFQEALRIFLKKHLYGNADHEDLLTAMNKVKSKAFDNQNFTLSQFLHDWIHKPRFPVVHVEHVNSTHLQLRQDAYKQHRAAPEELVWKVPIFLKDNRIEWLVDKTPKVVALQDELILNTECAYLRFQYDDATYGRIIERLHTNFHSTTLIERSRLIDDAFTFSEVGRISYRIAWNITASLIHETTGTPIHMLSAHLDLINVRMIQHQKYDIVKKFVIKTLEPHFKRFVENATTQSELDLPLSLDRSYEIVFTRMCQYDYQPCIDYANEQVFKLMKSCEFEHLSSRCNKIPVFMRTPLYSSAMRHNNFTVFEFFYRKWLYEPIDVEFSRIWIGFAWSQNKTQIYRIWDDIFNMFAESEDIRLKLREFATAKIVSTHNYYVDYVAENYENIYKKFEKSAELWDLIKRSMVKLIISKKQFESLEKLPNLPKNIKEAFKIKVADVENWMQSNGDSLANNITQVVHSLRWRI